MTMFVQGLPNFPCPADFSYLLEVTSPPCPLLPAKSPRRSFFPIPSTCPVRLSTTLPPFSPRFALSCFLLFRGCVKLVRVHSDAVGFFFPPYFVSLFACLNPGTRFIPLSPSPTPMLPKMFVLGQTFYQTHHILVRHFVRFSCRVSGSFALFVAICPLFFCFLPSFEDTLIFDNVETCFYLIAKLSCPKPSATGRDGFFTWFFPFRLFPPLSPLYLTVQPGFYLPDGS